MEGAGFGELPWACALLCRPFGDCEIIGGGAIIWLWGIRSWITFWGAFASPYVLKDWITHSAPIHLWGGGEWGKDPTTRRYYFLAWTQNTPRGTLYPSWNSFSCPYWTLLASYRPGHLRLSCTKCNIYLKWKSPGVEHCPRSISAPLFNIVGPGDSDGIHIFWRRSSIDWEQVTN